MMGNILVKNIGMLATPQGKTAKKGAEQGQIQILKDAWVLVKDGVIDSVGTGAAPAANVRPCSRFSTWRRSSSFSPPYSWRNSNTRPAR